MYWRLWGGALGEVGEVREIGGGGGVRGRGFWGEGGRGGGEVGRGVAPDTALGQASLITICKPDPDMHGRL